METDGDYRLCRDDEVEDLKTEISQEETYKTGNIPASREAVDIHPCICV